MAIFNCKFFLCRWSRLKTYQFSKKHNNLWTNFKYSFKLLIFNWKSRVLSFLINILSSVIWKNHVLFVFKSRKLLTSISQVTRLLCVDFKFSIMKVLLVFSVFCVASISSTLLLKTALLGLGKNYQDNHKSVD